MSSKEFDRVSELTGKNNHNMKTLNSVKKLALGLAVGGSFLAVNANATVSYAFDPGNTQGLTSANVPSGVTAFTQVFSVANSDTINVSALGVYAFELINNVTVSIYDSTSGGVTSGSALATKTFGSANQLASDYAYLSTSLNLSAGTYAIVTSYTGGNGTSGYYQGFTPVTPYSGPYVTLGNLYANGVGPINDTIYGSGNMKFGLAPVPEAAGFTMAGVVLLGIVFFGRSYARKMKIA